MMSFDPQELIDGYLDDRLSPNELEQLETWIQECPQNAREFASAAMLHDRLRDEQVARSGIARFVVDGCKPNPAEQDSEFESTPKVRIASIWRWNGLRSIATAASVLATAAGLLIILWNGFGDSVAVAGVVELNRLIATSVLSFDQTYQIDVEDVALARRRGGRGRDASQMRPPKPPMDAAILHVRGQSNFVLIRKTVDGADFVTGSNGRSSWAALPDGPVRVSSDLSRFNRDVPGHEFHMPLSNINEGLSQMRVAYDLHVLPIENPDGDVSFGEGASRLLVAVKKKGYPGPRRVEITYSVSSGHIEQLRFIEMPYGPDRLTLRLTLVEERDLGPDFFDHSSHHTSDRTVIEE